MANPTTESGIYQASQSWSVRVRKLPLLVRRGGALAAEVSLIALSAGIPFGMGVYAKSQSVGDGVPLNPVLSKVEEAIAHTLALPTADPDRRVGPLTNLFWSGALVLPLAMGGWQLYLLCKTGQTPPKRWLGVQVVAAAGMPPSPSQVLMREGVSRWGTVLGVAYLVWRYSGAFPDLGILSGLVGALLLGDGLVARFHPQGRTLHDQLAGTYVLDTAQTTAVYPNNLGATQPLRWSKPSWWRRSRHWEEVDEEAAIAAIVLSPESDRPLPSPGLWGWMRQHPGTTLLGFVLAGMGAVLGTFAGTQVYIQHQESLRDSKQQENEMFLDLVSQLTPTVPGKPEDRRSTILALGSIGDPRAIPLLVALLGQEDVPSLIDATQQGLVMTGPPALGDLRELNQALRNELESMQYGGKAAEKTLLELRLRATQRAIAQLLTIHSGSFSKTDLSRTDLGHKISNPFKLVLDGVNLAGIRLRGAILTHASLEGSSFYGPGEDGRYDTFDDWIADLSGADLQEANLKEAILSRAWMSRTNLMQANLNQANLSGATLTGANLSSAQSIGADFQNALLDGASLTGADLTQANLSGANLQGANLGRVNAQGSRLEGANLIQSNWQGADLSAANLANADLQNADLSSTALVGANLSGANLKDVNLQNADLSFVDLRGANLDGANFKGVKFVASSGKIEQFIERSPQALQFALVQGVDFTKAQNLEPTQITYLCDRGATHPQCSR